MKFEFRYKTTNCRGTLKSEVVHVTKAEFGTRNCAHGCIQILNDQICLVNCKIRRFV